MSAKTNDNPILPMLTQLCEQWLAFEEVPHAVIGLWAVKPEEYRMIEVFYEVEQTEEGQIPSLFVRFNTSFHGEETYGQALFNDLKNNLSSDDNQASLIEAGISLHALKMEEEQAGTAGWLHILGRLASLTPDLDGHIVAFLNPEINESPEQWIQWLMNVLDLGLPPKVKIMTVDLAESTLFAPIHKYYPQSIQRLETDLNMAKAMQKLAAQGGANPNDDPGILYRQSFVALVQSARPGELAQAREHAAKALEIATEQDWPHLRVAVYMALAAALLTNQEQEEAIDIYDQAVTAAQKARQQEEKLGVRLEIQSLMGKGAVFLQLQDYTAAAQCYELAGTLADSIASPEMPGDGVLAIDGWRLAGFAYEMDKDYYAAWDAGQKALESSKHLPPDQQKNTTLPFVGAALLRLAGKTDNRKAKADIHEWMEQVIGPDWQEKAKIEA